MTILERLARWLHAEYLAHCKRVKVPAETWDDLDEQRRNGYRAVACSLIDKSPGWLKKAVGGKK